MGILNSFDIGVTGLTASGSAMNVVGDNIANSGTNGFKSSRAEFQDVLATSLRGIDGGDQLGAGTSLAHVRPVFTQGSITRTESITDLAINGNGFFAVEAPFGRGYTRDGSFHFDKEGFLINGDGHRIVGFEANENGEITNKITAIKLGGTAIPARSTSKIAMSMNLDSREKIQEFNAEQPDKTSAYNTSVTVYDNVGTSRLVTIYFNKIEDNAFEYHAMIDGKDAKGGTEGKLIEMGSGKLVFDNKGRFQEKSTKKNSFNFNKGASPDQKIDFDFGKSIKDGGTGIDAITMYGSKSAVNRHNQDGASAGALASLSFNDAGVLTAVYNNGESRDVAQIGIAKFENNEDLFKVGKNLFKESRKSGQGAFGKPGESGRGGVLSKSIELSNVDIATEFVNLMTAQRNFQANAKTISTADKMLQEVLALKHN